MRVVAKSSLTKAQMKAKINSGAKYIELHMNPRDIDMPLKDINELRDIMKEHGVIITSIHLPTNGIQNITFIDLLSNVKQLKFACFLMELLPSAEEVVCIIHNEYDLETLKQFKIFEETVETIKNTKRLHSKFILGIENVSPLTNSKSGILVRKTRGIENVDVVNYLGTDISCVVFDTCHAMSQAFLDEKVLGHADRYEEIRDNLLPFAKVVHLADCDGLGILPGTHGIAFKDDNRLIDITRPLLRDGINIVLEIKEADYTDPVEFRDMKNVIDENFMAKRGI